MKDKLKQNTIVYYSIDKNLKGYGKIVGLSTNDRLPIIGHSYIIEPEIPISLPNYPYSHFVLFEYQFRLLTICELRKRKLESIGK